MTKIELQQINSRLAADNQALREQNAELRATVETLRDQLGRAASALVRGDHTQVSERRAQMEAAREEAKRTGRSVRI